MIRVAFTLIGGYQWFGGYNYQLNLFKALTKYERYRIKPYIFLGEDVDKNILKNFVDISGLEVIQSNVFNQSASKKRLMAALITGQDKQALRAFSFHRIDAVFEAANFYGWRFPKPVTAWVPDLQHKFMPHLFSRLSYWKRDIGFRFQVSSNRRIMLSSEDAKTSFERFYPKATGRTSVARFAVPTQVFKGDLDALLNQYELPSRFFFLPNQFWQHKNHQSVIEALSIAKKAGHDITVVATGNTHDPRNPQHFANLEALVSQYRLTDHFRILGPIPYQHIIGLMQACQALINPSFFEGWSTTVEEAKASGTNMLLSDLAVHREQASEYAVFFDPQSPEELAQQLINFKIEKESNNKISKQIKQEAGARVAKYASEFTDIIALLA